MYPHHRSGYTVRCAKYDDEREENVRKQERSHKQPPMTIIQLEQTKRDMQKRKKSSNQVVSRTE
jgi:hypothetical protein